VWNAYFYYLFPLMIALVFLLGGATVFRRFARGERDPRGRKYGNDAGVGGILLMLIGGAVALEILTSPTPWARQRLFRHIFHTPPEHIRQIVIEPAAHRVSPLGTQPLVVSDPAQIRQMAALLADARQWDPNHPRESWGAGVEMVTDDGSYVFRVMVTPSDSNGTLIWVGERWNLGTWRADGLERLIESAAHFAAATSAPAMK
jgi:hypothetical protein